jgi:hypothetical protein
MFHQALPVQVRQYRARVCECGTRRKPPYVAVTREEEPLHAVDGQARVNACCDCTPPTRLFAAAALPQNPYSSPQETRQVLTGVWMYENDPLPAQIRHLPPSAAPAAFGPVPAVYHQVPAQMSVIMHHLYDYRDFRLFMPEMNPHTCADNWKHVLRYFPDINLEYETIQSWPNGRLVCFCIWWNYSWDVLQALDNDSDQHSMDKKLEHALLCEHIPGVSIQDFFEIQPAQIKNSHAPTAYVYSGSGTGIKMHNWIDHGVYCCKIAEHAKHENTKVQNDNIFKTLLLFFVLQSEYDERSHYHTFSTHMIKDAFEHLAAVWDASRRQTFACAFEKLQAKYIENNESVSKDDFWALICAPAGTKANYNATWHDKR